MSSPRILEVLAEGGSVRITASAPIVGPTNSEPVLSLSPSVPNANGEATDGFYFVGGDDPIDPGDGWLYDGSQGVLMTTAGPVPFPQSGLVV